MHELRGRFYKTARVDTTERDESQPAHPWVFRDEDGDPFMWSPRPYRYEYHRVETPGEADHVSFLCPLCYDRHQAELTPEQRADPEAAGVGIHGVMVSLAGRIIPDEVGSRSSDGKPSRWTHVSGNSLDDLVLSPSIFLTSPGGCMWHGFLGSSGVPAGHAR